MTRSGPAYMHRRLVSAERSEAVGTGSTKVHAIHSSAGFSLMEVMAVVAALAILMAISFPPLFAYTKSIGFKNAVNEVREDLNSAHEDAMSEATASQVYGISFNTGAYEGGTYDIFQTNPDPNNVVRTVQLGSGVYIDSASCTGGTPPTTETDCYFYAKGTATPGTIVICQNSCARQEQLTIVALSGRVDET